MAFSFVFVISFCHLIAGPYALEISVQQRGRPNPIKMHGKKPTIIKDVRRFIQVETGRMPNQIFVNQNPMADEVELVKSPLLKLPRLVFEYDLSNTVILPCSLSFIEAEGQFKESFDIQLKVDIGVVTSFQSAISQINQILHGKKRIPPDAKILFVFKNVQNDHLIMKKSDYLQGCDAFKVESLEAMPAEKRYCSGIKSTDLLKRELIGNDAADAQILTDLLGMKMSWSDVLIWYPTKVKTAYDDDFYIFVLDMSKHGAIHLQKIKINPKVTRIWEKYYSGNEQRKKEDSKCCSVQ